MRVAIYDLSGGAKTANGESLTPTTLAELAGVYTAFLREHVGPVYGGAPHGVRVATPGDLRKGEVRLLKFATLPPEDDGAIALHTLEGDSVPLMIDAVTLSDSLFGPGNSMSVADTHEIAEALRDPGCNLYADDGQGTETAEEVGDPVEDQSFPLYCMGLAANVYCTNFVLPTWFIPGAKGYLDYVSTLPVKLQPPGFTPPPAPLVIAPGDNYSITRPIGGDWTADVKRRKAKREHWSSRTRRRLEQRSRIQRVESYLPYPQLRQG